MSQAIHRPHEPTYIADESSRMQINYGEPPLKYEYVFPLQTSSFGLGKNGETGVANSQMYL